MAILSSNVEVRQRKCLSVRLCLACESRNNLLSVQTEGAVWSRAGGGEGPGQYTDLAESELSKCYWINGWTSVYWKQYFDGLIGFQIIWIGKQAFSWGIWYFMETSTWSFWRLLFQSWRGNLQSLCKTYARVVHWRSRGAYDCILICFTSRGCFFWG